MATLSQILEAKWPGCQYATRIIDGVETITSWWEENPFPQPTLAEVTAFSDEVDGIVTRRAMKVTPRQFCLALAMMPGIEHDTLYEDAVAMVAVAGLPVQITWERAITFERTSPLIDAFALQLGKSAEEVDALFLAAAQIGD